MIHAVARKPKPGVLMKRKRKYDRKPFDVVAAYKRRTATLANVLLRMGRCHGERLQRLRIECKVLTQFIETDRKVLARRGMIAIASEGLLG